MGIIAPHHLNTFARRLALARKEKKLSQQRLGILAGIDTSSASARMNQYERGKHMPDFLMISKIAQVLDVPTAYFYIEDDHLAQLIQAYHRLTPPQKQQLLEFIQQFSTPVA